MANINPQSNSDIIEAIHAAKSGELNHARILFEKTIREGNKTPKLFYNLGVVYYKLTQYSAAKKAFLHLTHENELSELAFYNLALIEIKLNNTHKALDWLNKIIKNNRYQKMHQMAYSLKNKILKKTNYAILPRQESKSNLHDAFPFSKKSNIKTKIRTELGYNDNIAQFRYIKKKDERTTGDNFLFLQIDSGIKISPHFNLEASTFYTAYEKKSYFNSINLQTTINYTNRIKRWKYKIDGGYIRQNNNGVDYRETTIVSASLFRYIFQNVEYNTTISNNFIRILDNTYKHLGGIKLRWAHQIDYHLKTITYTFSYHNEINRRNNFTSNDGLSFTNFSSNTHRTEIFISPYINPSVSSTFLIGGEYLYQSKNNRIYGRRMDRRKDFEFHFGFDMTYQFQKETQLSARYRYSKNESTLNDYRYQNSLYQFGIIWTY